MSGYSKENQRQNEALQNIMDGGKPEKRIFVSGVDKEFKKELEEKEAQEKKITKTQKQLLS